MSTTVCNRLGIDLPTVLAPMGGAVGPELAAAVSNTGGLGSLPLWYQDIGELRRIVRATQSLTHTPFAANLNMEFPQEDQLDACLEEGVPIISFFWQDPGKLIRTAKDAGAVVMQTVGDAEAAKRAVDSGVDVIVAQGWEAGGHVRGAVATMPLIPAVVEKGRRHAGYRCGWHCRWPWARGGAFTGCRSGMDRHKISFQRRSDDPPGLSETCPASLRERYHLLQQSV